MTIIPLTNDGARTVTVETPAGQLTLRTYWQPLLASWLCDISDGAGNALLSGISLVGGCPNLLKGCGLSLLEGFKLQVVEQNDGDSRTTMTWGTTSLSVLFDTTEEPYLMLDDPMLADVPLTEEV